MVTDYPTATAPPGTPKDRAELVAKSMTFSHGVTYTVHALPDGRWQVRPNVSRVHSSAQ